MKNVIIQAFTVELSQEEIRSKIPSSIIDKIKQKGLNPFFQAYSIIHEGITSPKVIGEEGYTKIAWPRQAVNSVKGLITKGLQFFIGHRPGTNSTNNRRSIGKVIADFQKEISGKLHHIVIGHFPNKQEASKYDVCSIEAQADFQEVEGISFAQKVAKITGIALGSSNEDSPAFPGAVKLATLQAFGTDDNTNKNKKLEGDSTMTFEEIKKLVRDMNIWPHQLYDITKLKDDINFGKYIKAYDKNKTDIEKLNTIITEKDAEIAKANKKASLGDVKETFKSLIPEGATKKQKDFYNKKFKPEDMEDISEEALKKFIEKTQDEYKEMAAVFGVKDDESSDTDNSGSDDDASDLTEDEILDEITNDVITSS